MALNDLVQPVAAAVTSQVKLCPYDEEEPHIWFRLIEAQFAAAGINFPQCTVRYLQGLPTAPHPVTPDQVLRSSGTPKLSEPVLKTNRVK
jgi:hypothetical protein